MSEYCIKHYWTINKENYQHEFCPWCRIDELNEELKDVRECWKLCDESRLETTLQLDSAREVIANIVERVQPILPIIMASPFYKGRIKSIEAMDKTNANP